MFPLALLNGGDDGWNVTSAHTFSKTNVDGRAMLLGASVSTGGSSETWLSALEDTVYSATSSIRVNYTASNVINTNATNAGITHWVKAVCYDSGGLVVGSVGLRYTFYTTGTVMFTVNVVLENPSYISSDQKTQLGVLSFNASDVFKLSVDVTTKNWTVIKEGGGSVDGDALLGLMPATTAYVRYYVDFHTGQNITGFAEMQVLLDS